ncbi:hypothetical protein [Glaciibacter psychrotolerans]|uniref:Uncharacterized protein n=1 Tax=Glaciibacter psychrotolerans TaxID=670054 RepID=A0A7Z0EE21_9MICO|nr:hypothetical protein [Leifsonia psychrotolerans]NYJ19202.1 hypothetical protein [Leifsonia psychrotolerans]
MSTFAEKKAAAQAVEREFKDVVVALKSDLDGKRNELMAQLAAAVKAKTVASKSDVADIQSQIAAIEAQERDTLVTVRLYKVPPVEWVSLTKVSGYDMNITAAAAAVNHAVILDGEDELAQTAEEWAELWALIGSPGFSIVLQGTYALNVTEPQERLERLKNSSEVATASAKK